MSTIDQKLASVSSKMCAFQLHLSKNTATPLPLKGLFTTTERFQMKYCIVFPQEASKLSEIKVKKSTFLKCI